MRVIVIGTRGSLLALAQTRWVVERLKENWPEVEFRTKTITNRSEDPAAGLQDALRKREIDIALHALRDLPPAQADGLHLTAVTRRVDPREAFVGRNAKRLEDLPDGAVVGAPSLRRKAQLLAYRPDLVVRETKGDVDDQLEALGTGEYDAIIMPAGSLLRLDLRNRIDQFVDPEILLPAPGQGALGLEVRLGDDYAEELAYSLNHRPSSDRVCAERAFVAALGVGLEAPVAALAFVEDDGTLRLEGGVFSPDGREMIRGEIEGDASEAVELGSELAQDLLAEGGKEILEQAKVS